MSQQGERSAAHEDDWWRRLYDENARDTGTSNAADSLDDRFDSASDAVGPGGRGGSAGEARTTPAGEAAPPRGEAEGGSRSAVAVPRQAGERAPWEPPAATVRASGASPAGPSQPRTFAAPPVPADPPPAPDPAPAPEPPTGPSIESPIGPPTGDAVSVPPVPPVPSVPPLPRRPVAERPAAPPVPVAPSAPDTTAAAPAPEAERETACVPRSVIGHVGDRPPTYDAEPTALPATVPQELDGLVSDTVLDGARYGTYTLRAASVRGDSARFRGEPRRDALLTARFGTDEHALVLVAVATGARATESAHLAAADACRWIGAAVGRSHARLSEDIRAGRRGDLKSGLNRLTDRTYGKLRARAAELGKEPRQYTAGLRCLLLPADPECRTRIFFGIGAGGLLRLRDGIWQDLEPEVPAAGDTGADPGAGSGPASPGNGPDSDRLTMDPAVTAPASSYAGTPLDPPAEPFRFRGSVARPGDTLLLCSPGLAEPLRGEPALARELAGRWAPGTAPGLVTFLADTQLRVKGYADDRTGVGVWEA
ncbi:protein phosphatase 2C domain-containing protein [Streptomyces sp. NBC_01363]|uniref:protein phosphatase 2C domain-containing protein n=1 Tax=Streptomyces sp. NBC_01363 TaxID=2903840 RepID=UPI00225BBA05|nr:protein phosphatase 2C domain-containing protein [Streptomyces sp. NBC_01363]MCX4735627.1 protein phosphatase 2C domain-containing protein [Streptomyces sp. NBC_01363]